MFLPIMFLIVLHVDVPQPVLRAMDPPAAVKTVGKSFLQLFLAKKIKVFPM